MGGEIVLQCGRDTGFIAQYLADCGVTMNVVEAWEGIDRWGLSDRAVLEYFDGQSFADAIKDKTLFAHATELAETYELAIFVIVTELPEYSEMHGNAVRGALSALPIRYGITVLGADDEREAARLIRQIAEHEQSGVPEISLHPKRKAQDLPDMQRRVAEMLPGCGVETARKLLRQFGSLRAAANASQAQLRQIDGIGKKTAARINNVWSAEYLDIDWESDIEDAVVSNPDILFDMPVQILARQHRFSGSDGQPLIPDIVAADVENSNIYIVELKRGRPNPADVRQIRRYLENAAESELLAARIDDGFGPRGILASPQPPRCECEHPDITIVTVSEDDILAELEKLRKN